MAGDKPPLRKHTLDKDLGKLSRIEEATVTRVGATSRVGIGIVV